jgi:6-phosphogluconolactonase (cycloisomerase 2 family)
MHPLRRIAAFLGIAALLLAGSLTSAQRVFAAKSDVVGHVYVNDNSSPINTIGAFDRHADGSLTPTPGSPFIAGGYGKAVPSQGALQMSPDGKYLLAVDAGSNQISVLSIASNGSLKLVNGSPVSSGGAQPVSIAAWGNEVVVANDGGGSNNANYTAFQINSGGHLSPTGWSYSLSAPAAIVDVLFSPDGTHLIGIRDDTSQIDSFNVSANGTITAASNSPFNNPTGFYGPFGSAFLPTDSSKLYVSNAHTAAGTGVTPGTVSAFSVGGDGSLSLIGGAPVAATGQTATCWVAISHSGQYLFSVNTGSGSVSSFSIGSDGSLTYGSSTALTGTGLGALDAGIDPTDSFLYVVERGANRVAGLQVNGDGSTTELASSPTALPAGSAAFGIVVD